MVLAALSSSHLLYILWPCLIKVSLCLRRGGGRRPIVFNLEDLVLPLLTLPPESSLPNGSFPSWGSSMMFEHFQTSSAAFWTISLLTLSRPATCSSRSKVQNFKPCRTGHYGSATTCQQSCNSIDYHLQLRQSLLPWVLLLLQAGGERKLFSPLGET